MRRDVVLSVTLDKAAADALRQLAEARAEGNKSLTIRTLVREEAARVAASTQPAQPGQGVRDDGR